MFAKKIELVNFQKHSSFIAEFSKGVNVVHGETDAGKSCIIRALRWVMFNEPKGDVVRKDGTDLTRVILTLDNDIQIIRIKSATLNAYEIIKDGETKRYDSIGKEVPVDVVKVLGVFPMEVDGENLILNIAPQLSLPFLLSESAGFRMKVFNKLTGNDILDKVSQTFNKDILSAKREVASRAGEIEGKSKILAETEKIIIRLSRTYETVKRYFDVAGKRAKDHAEVLALYDKSGALLMRLMDNKEAIDEIKIPDPGIVDRLKSKVQIFDAASRAVTGKAEKEQEIEAAGAKIASFRLPEGVPALKERIKGYEAVAQMVKDRAEKVVLIKTADDGLEVSTGLLASNLARYRDLLKELKVCPICKRDLPDEVIEGIKI